MDCWLFAAIASPLSVTYLLFHHWILYWIITSIWFHEQSWLSSTHSSAAGTATKDFSDSRGLLQLVDSLTRGNAILDFVFYGHSVSLIGHCIDSVSNSLNALIKLSTPSAYLIENKISFLGWRDSNFMHHFFAVAFHQLYMLVGITPDEQYFET